MSLVPLPTTSAASKSFLVRWNTRDAGSSGLYPLRTDCATCRKPFDDESPIDTVLGVEIFPVVHVKTQEKIYVSLEDITDD